MFKNFVQDVKLNLYFIWLNLFGRLKEAQVRQEAVLNEGSAKAVIEGVINYVNNVSTFDVVFVNKGGKVVEKALKVAEPDKVATLLPGSADVEFRY